jgi:hypothetical protein
MKRLALVSSLAIIIVITIIILRSPYISDALKKIILPELEMVTGKKVVAEDIYINIFPLFIEAKDLKIVDDNGQRILYARGVKAYMELAGFLSRNIVVRRLVVKEPEVASSREQINGLIEKIGYESVKPGGAPSKIVIRVIEAQKGEIHISDDKTGSISDIYGLRGEFVLGEINKIRANAGKVVIRKDGWPEISFGTEARLSIKDGLIRFDRLIINSAGSTLGVSGEYHEAKGTFESNIELLAMTVKKIFNLRNSGEGKIDARGSIAYSDKKIELDLEVAGKFYIQTLMELLKVNERIEGLVDVNGTIKGPLNDIKGLAEVTFVKGNLFDVDIESLECKVSYAEGEMNFFDGESRLYNGSARASATISLPVVDSFSLDIDYEDIDSVPLFKLIGWEPGFPNGKVKGALSSSGPIFNPKGWFEYRNADLGEDVINRVTAIEGTYSMEGDVISLDNAKIMTGISDLVLNGTVNIETEALYLDGKVRTDDVVDITFPYYDQLRGRGEFVGALRGTFERPVIKGVAKMQDLDIEKYPARLLDADISYTQDNLVVNELLIKGDEDELKLNGNVYFETAQNLFDLSNPEFDLRASIDNVDFTSFIMIFFGELRGSGRLSSGMRIKGSGSNPLVTGDAVIEKAILYDVPVNVAHFDFSYAAGILTEMSFSVLNLTVGERSTIQIFLPI